MDHSVSSGTISTQRTGCAIVGVFDSGKLGNGGGDLEAETRSAIRKLVSAGDLRGKLGDTLVLPNPGGMRCERMLLVGCGERAKFGLHQFRKAHSAAIERLSRSGATDAISYLTREKVRGANAHTLARHAVEAVEESTYRFNQMKSVVDGPLPHLERFAVAFERSARKAAEAGIGEGLAIAHGVALARDLGNLPANVCTPTHLADTARKIAQGDRRIKTKIIERDEMEKLGMGAFLSVSQGADTPPKLIVLEYRGGGKNDAPVVLVGKGITFDSGGISIKPAASMDEMKYDMCGAAGVLGAMRALRELKLPLNVVCLVPACENMPSGRASRPGDIVKSMSGLTVEILNTDAEGRLILCDALSYARRFEPRAVIDVATLTGACVIALGGHFSGLMSNDERLTKQLLDAGKAADDRAWQLPLSDEYGEQLKSNFADLANVGGRAGGAITAASFLSRFTEDMSWAHLDIAGTAWLTGKQKGGTGRPVSLLVQYLLDRCADG